MHDRSLAITTPERMAPKARDAPPVSPCPSRHTRNWVFPCRFDWNATAVEVFERVRAAMDD